MQLICPACGASASAETWAHDAVIRQCLVVAAELPREVSRAALDYLGLFRPSAARRLQWGRALRLLGDLRELVGRGYVSKGHGVDRPCPPAVWGEALARILDNPPRSLPLKNHHYLMAIAYDLADTADRAAEVKRNALERSGTLRRAEDRSEGEPERIDFEWMVQQRKKNFGKLMRDKGSGE